LAKEEISYKDLSNRQLDNLKRLYIESRLSEMSEENLRLFVKTIITDQITGTVGHQEEKEAWKEMKDHFGDNFEKTITAILKESGISDESLSPEQQELEKRLELLEKRRKDSDNLNSDMW
tara:strand:- start:479 stop:838 length:360 start_codon:yes stop_codon:yes gene_type:complete